MKRLSGFISFVLVILITIPLFAQKRLTKMTEKELKSLQKRYPRVDFSKLREMAIRQNKLWQKRHREALKKAKQKGLPIIKKLKDGKTIELQYFEGDLPIYFTPYNLIAAKTISTASVWRGPYYLSGSEINIGLWDQGKIYTSHQEFKDAKIYWKDSTNIAISIHATNVTGTMLAAGIIDSAHGMAPNAIIFAYDWYNDLSELIDFSGYINVSNHSYGSPTGWHWEVDASGSGEWVWYGDPEVSYYEDYRFGFYDERSHFIDSLTALNLYLLPVVAVGNDRSDNPGDIGTHRHAKDNDYYDDRHDGDGEKDGGYDCIPAGFATAKNTLVVGAVHDIPNGYFSSYDVVMTNMSSWGPTDDGRIKPDVVANGYDLFTTGTDSENDYDYYSGTSAAAPSVAASIALLLEKAGTSYFSSTIKAIIINTADEAGDSPGPDYKYGWGLMNTQKAIELIDQDQIEGWGSHIKEYQYSGPVEFHIQAEGEVRVTICWADPAADISNASVDPTDRKLVNDIDARLIADDGSGTFFPYILDPGNPSAPADTGDNSIDNVEHIYAYSTSPTYTLKISDKGITGYQWISIVVSGGHFYIPEEEPPVQDVFYQVTLDQQLSDGNSVGQLQIWDYSLDSWSEPFYVPNTVRVDSTDPYLTSKSSSAIYSEQKFNRWEAKDTTSEFSWETFIIREDQNIISKFEKIGKATFLKFKLISANSETDGEIYFKDPWIIDTTDPSYYYINQDDPHPNKPRGYRNKGMKNADFDTLFLPATLDQNPPRKGVFLNQGITPQGQWAPPYYTVRVPQEQVFPFHNEDIIWYFQGWEGDNVSFQNASQNETAVVFQADGAEARAVYKGHLASNSSLAIRANNGRKIVSDDVGNYHLVYEDNGEIYYTFSSNGIDWSADERVSDGHGNNRYPSIAIGAANKYHIVWQKFNGWNAYEIRYKR
ncbi:MAG: S8 family serine peptidase [Calditrichaeota bacterium]|nr:S8 family serine peptidase [Calditrichota bacterium]